MPMYLIVLIVSLTLEWVLKNRFPTLYNRLTMLLMLFTSGLYIVGCVALICPVYDALTSSVIASDKLLLVLFGGLYIAVFGAALFFNWIDLLKDRKNKK